MATNRNQLARGIFGERVPLWVTLLLIVLGVIGCLMSTYTYLYPQLLHENLLNCYSRTASTASCNNLKKKMPTELATVQVKHPPSAPSLEL